MIEKSVIYAVLIGIAVTGVVPVIGGIALLLTGKLKGSSFWAGVLTFIIEIIVSSIIISIASMPFIDVSGGAVSAASVSENSTVIIISAIVNAVCFALSMGICIKSCMKKTRSFKGGISCGAGAAVGYAVTAAISFAVMYAFFVMINSGAFDRQYAPFIEQGVISKDDFTVMKAMYTDITASEMFSETASTVGYALSAAASGVFIMRFVCAKKTFLGILTAFIIILAEIFAAMIPNVIALIVVTLAIGAAALIFAFRMRESIVPEQAPAVKDDFITSIENAKNDSDPYNVQ